MKYCKGDPVVVVIVVGSELRFGGVNWGLPSAGGPRTPACGVTVMGFHLDGH